MRPRLTCRELVQFLADYLAGELAGAPLADFEWHLARCPNCVAFVSTYREARALARAALGAPDAPVPEVVPEGLVRAILAARGA